MKGLYLPPVFNNYFYRRILSPHHHYTACSKRRCECPGLDGALVVVTAVQLSVLGFWNLPPVLEGRGPVPTGTTSPAPHNHQSARPHSRVPESRPARRVGCACSCPTVRGRVVPASRVKFPSLKLVPPQMTIALPVQTRRVIMPIEGALLVVVAAHVSVVGLYLAPVFTTLNLSSSAPPQTIISLPVHTIV